jgi:hypothetical protein
MISEILQLASHVIYIPVSFYYILSLVYKHDRANLVTSNFIWWFYLLFKKELFIS